MTIEKRGFQLAEDIQQRTWARDFGILLGFAAIYFSVKSSTNAASFSGPLMKSNARK
jgi:hypothetical protein